MKMLNCLKACSRKLHRGALAATLLGLASFAGMNSHAASSSPVGTWDFVVSGPDQGVAFINFDEISGLTGNVTGLALIAPTPHDSLTTDRGAVDEGRTDTNNVSNTASNVIGVTLLSGSWSFDQKGHVIGVFSEMVSNATCTLTPYTHTNEITQLPETLYTNVCVTNIFTNGFSFTANARPNHLALKARGERGLLTFRGVPLQSVPDLSGSYYGLGRRSGSPNYTEFLTLGGTSSPYVYDVAGQSAIQPFSGNAIVSSQKRIAFMFLSSSNTIDSVGVGSINFRNRRMNLSTEDFKFVHGNLKVFPQ
jgi:hypothetical protein